MISKRKFSTNNSHYFLLIRQKPVNISLTESKLDIEKQFPKLEKCTKLGNKFKIKMKKVLRKFEKIDYDFYTLSFNPPKPEPKANKGENDNGIEFEILDEYMSFMVLGGISILYTEEPKWSTTPAGRLK